MVNVFPDPVCPDAKMVPLYPCITLKQTLNAMRLECTKQLHSCKRSRRAHVPRNKPVRNRLGSRLKHLILRRGQREDVLKEEAMLLLLVIRNMPADSSRGMEKEMAGRSDSSDETISTPPNGFFAGLIRAKI